MRAHALDGTARLLRQGLAATFPLLLGKPSFTKRSRGVQVRVENYPTSQVFPRSSVVLQSPAVLGLQVGAEPRC